MFEFHKASILFLSFVLLLGISACSQDDDKDSSSTPSYTVTGSTLPAISAGKLEVLNEDYQRVGGPVDITDGVFEVDIPQSSVSGLLFFSVSSGSYTDGVATSTVELDTTYPLKLTLAPDTLTADKLIVRITPASTVLATAFSNWTGSGTSTEKLTAATTAFETAFGFTPDTSVSATEEATTLALAKLRANAFSQLTRTLVTEASSQGALLNGLGKDLSDGTLDGTLSTTALTVGTTTLAVDVQNQYEVALLKYFNDNTATVGLTADQIGQPAFAKTALSTTYRIVYVPGTMGAMQGKTMFSLQVLDRVTGQAVTSYTPTLKLMMTMSSMSHSSPQAGCTLNSTTSQYDCTVYYLMASSMSDGTSMGYWKLTATVNSEAVSFYPNVGMSMGDTVRGTLKGIEDKIISMSTSASRSWYLFKNALSGATGNHTFKVFLATQESMMSFPTVTSSSTLNSGTSSQLAISSIVLQASTDASTWSTMTEAGNGIWTISGLSGLTTGTSGSIYLKLTVNNEQKTTDGAAVSGTNGYATFTVTP
ncbi:MAG: hypothetical protein HQM11_08980 [SAR324 cluster bacterium]|nr:hypothetical protein [SAR324 cluster bacterium]